MTQDRNILRSELPAILGRSSESIRRAIKDQRLPPFDFRVSRKTCGWKLSTLRNAGFDIAV